MRRICTKLVLVLLCSNVYGGMKHIDNNLLLCPSHDRIHDLRSKLLTYWNDETIQLFFTKYIDYSLRKKRRKKNMETKKQNIIPTWPALYSVSANFGLGRIGNQLCNIATAYGLFKEYNVTTYLSRHSYNLLKNTFMLPNVISRKGSEFYKQIKLKHLDMNRLSWVYIKNEELIFKKEEILNIYKYSWFLKLDPNVCDFKGFLPFLDDLRKSLLQFDPHVLRDAKEVIKNVRLGSGNKNIVVISIHIRMTDMMAHLEKTFGLSPPSESYFTRAMMHFEKKFGQDVAFVALSDDVSKAKQMLLTENNKRFDIVFPDLKNKASTSLALLSLVQGSIITFGTFGLWGALLGGNGCELIMPKDFVHTDVGFHLSSSGLKNIIYT